MKISIRVDGGFKIGLGHLYKCIWLADALRKKGHEVIFLTTEDPVAVSLIRRNGFSAHFFLRDETEGQKIQFTNQWLLEKKPTVLFVDHWFWPQDYWVSLEKPPGTFLAAADIPSEGFSRFDLAFQGPKNSFVNSEFAKKGCKVYEGPHYMMIPPQFRPYTGSWKPPSRLRNILLTFGGTDIGDFSIKTLDYFDRLPYDYHLTLVLGLGSANLKSVEDRLKGSSLKVDILRDVSCLPAHMSRSDLVVSTAGSGTLSELALTGTPAIVFAAVPHQVKNARQFGETGGILNCAKKPGVVDEQFCSFLRNLTNNPDRLRILSEKWHGLMDARGIERIVEILETYC